MLAELIAALAFTASVVLIRTIGERLWGEKMADPRHLPESIRTELSEHDKEMAEKTQILIQEVFARNGKTVVESIADMNLQERLETVKCFTERLKELYGLDNEFSFFLDEGYQKGNDIYIYQGNYIDEKNLAEINLLNMAWDSQDRDFEAHILKFLSTIIHEERHAIQNRVVREPDFWDVDDDCRELWMNNLANYIDGETDIRAYQLQPIERDAKTFANYVIKGVK